MKTQVYIDRHRIAANKKNGTNLAPISVRTWKGVQKAHSVKIEGESQIQYKPHKPLSCGAVAWIETQGAVSLFDEKGAPITLKTRLKG